MVGQEEVAELFIRREAANYDSEIGTKAVTDPAVQFLADRFDIGSQLLECGVGTGRIALPLAAVGIRVTGVDRSSEMLAILADKDPQKTVDVREADMRTVSLDKTFDIITCVFNTIYALYDQDEQRQFIANAARHLAKNGTLVIETQIIGLHEFRNNKIIAPTELESDHVGLVAIIHEPVEQVLRRQDIVLGNQDVRTSLMRLRYIWPSELDLMARLAGLRLIGRYGDWSGSRFDGTGNCISLYAHEVQAGSE